MNTKKLASLKSVNIAASPSETNKPDNRKVDDLGKLQKISDRSILQLHQHLQGTLAINQVMGQFYSWLNLLQNVDSLEYSHDDENILLVIGEAKHHNAQYVVRLGDTYLGSVKFTSRKRFTEQDLYNHEQSIAVLIHYLKNALEFNQLQKIALHDPLTAVMNRASLLDLLPREVNRAQRYDQDLSVIMIDIDHFKSINDSVGHLGGDEVLRQVAEAIKSSVRGSDLAFRFGGDEFVILLPNTLAKGAHTAAEHIVEAVEKSQVHELYNIKPQLSMGIAEYRKGESHQELIRRADNALYKAKSNGRNCIC